MTYILPPAIAGVVRLQQNLNLIQTSPEFLAFCIKHWRSRTILDEILSLRLTPAELKDTPRSEKRRPPRSRAPTTASLSPAAARRNSASLCCDTRPLVGAVASHRARGANARLRSSFSGRGTCGRVQAPHPPASRLEGPHSSLYGRQPGLVSVYVAPLNVRNAARANTPLGLHCARAR